MTLRSARGPGQTRRRPASAEAALDCWWAAALPALEVAETVAAMGFRRTFGTDTNAKAPVRPQNG